MNNEYTLLLFILTLVSLAHTLPHSTDPTNELNQTEKSESQGGRIYRYDTVSVWEKHKKIPVQINIQDIDNHNQQVNILDKRQILNKSEVENNRNVLPLPVPLNASSAFVVTYDCQVNQTICTIAQNKFTSAIEKMVQGLVIYTPIYVKVTIRYFCLVVDATCARYDVIGQAGASSYFVGRLEGAREWSYFPQALVKQMTPNVAVEYGPFDIVAELNADYLSCLTPEGCTGNRTWIDPEFTIIHELTHGLGFDTFWYPWNIVYNDILSVTDKFMAPAVNLQQDTANRFYVDVPSWDYLHIYDNLLQTVANGTNTNFNQFAERITKFNIFTSTTPFVIFFQSFKASKDPFTAAIEAYGNVTSGPRTTIINPSGLYVSSFEGYVQGSSVAHIDYEAYWNTTEFLMTHSVGDNIEKSLDELIALYSANGTMYGPYGIKTLSVLDAMGWPTSLNNKTRNIILKTN